MDTTTLELVTYFTEIENKIGDLLFNDYVKAVKNYEDTQPVSDKIRILESERRESLKNLFIDNKVDLLSDDVNEAVSCKDCEFLNDLSALPVGYKVVIINCYHSCYTMSKYTTTYKVFAPNGETYFGQTGHETFIKMGTEFIV